MSFQSLGLPPAILRVLDEEAYIEPTPIQAASIPELLAGRDLLGSAQTGTGKTAAFCLPLIVRLGSALADQRSHNPDNADQRSGQGKADASRRRPSQHRQHGNRFRSAQSNRPIRGLILAPTRELAMQIQDSLRTYGRGSGLRQTVIVGGVNQFHQERALRQGADVVVATPGRLVDLMQQGIVDLSLVEVFILDEADRMFDLGFLPDMQRIVKALPSKRQNVMFSATMPAPLEELAREVLDNPVRIAIEPVAETTGLIEQVLCFVPQSEKTQLLIKMLSETSSSRTIVFTRTKHGADRVVEQLQKAGIDAEAMHGNKSQNARVRILSRFKSSNPPVLVATDLAARGIDVDAVSHVFNYELPHEPETYVHRIGRTGRAGASGLAIAFCSPAEMKQLRSIENLMDESIPIHPEYSRHRPSSAPPEKKQRRQGYGYGKYSAGGGEPGFRGKARKPVKKNNRAARNQRTKASRTTVSGGG